MALGVPILKHFRVKHMDVPVKIMFNLFDTPAIPILSYPCVTWDL